MKPNDFSQLNVLADTDFSRRSQFAKNAIPTPSPLRRSTAAP